MKRKAFSERILRKRGIFRLVKIYSKLFGTTTDVSTIYDKAFFDDTIEREAASANAVVKTLFDEFHPKEVLDVGCGMGIYLKGFSELGVAVHGCDGSEKAIQNNLVDQDYLGLVDLRKPHSFGRKWDLCICFEVAEHLLPKYATTLIETLTGASDRIVFTAAPPGQGGTHHFNEQPQEYWKDIFNTFGFVWKGDIVDRLRRQMRENNVVFWLEQNLMVFFRQP